MTADQRAHARAVMKFLFANAHHIGYTAVRPMPTRDLYEQHAATEFNRAAVDEKVIAPDCSEAVTLICKWIGAQSPSGPSFPYSSGDGNSGTMYDHLPHYTDPKMAGQGAIIEYKSGGTSVHVNMVFQSDPTNPLLFNHGGPGGPSFVRLQSFLNALPSYTPTFLAVGAL